MNNKRKMKKKKKNLPVPKKKETNSVLNHMWLPWNCESGLDFPFMSPDRSHSHIIQPPIS
jgi:hypothetical protein